jgi:hypothetical protein
MLKEPIPDDFKKTVLAVFEPRLTHELERMIAAINPSSKSGSIPTPQE